MRKRGGGGWTVRLCCFSGNWVARFYLSEILQGMLFAIVSDAQSLQLERICILQKDIGKVRERHNGGMVGCMGRNDRAGRRARPQTSSTARDQAAPLYVENPSSIRRLL